MPDDPLEPTDEELDARLQKLLGEVELADDEQLDEIELKLRDVEDQFEAHRESRHETEGLFDEEFEERLRNLHDRADAAKSRSESDKRETKKKAVTDADAAKGLGVGLTVAYTIIGCPLTGALIGWLVNRGLGTTNGIAVGVVIGAAFGMAAALMMLKRMD